MSLGIIYVNSSDDDLKYVNEAEGSAKSFKRYIPDAEYILYTDATYFTGSVFDAVLPASFEIPPKLMESDHKNGQMVAKHSVLPCSKYDRTMYLGSDTYALRAEVSSLFDLLDHFDLVAAHAPYRINTSQGNTAIPEIPVSFPEFNCDVVLYRKSPAVTSFLTKWRDLYLDHAFQHPHDQGAFRYLVWLSDLRICTIPPEYNYRGQAYRSDTVILQNREKLPMYLNGNAPEPVLAQSFNKICKYLKIPYRLNRC